MTNRIFFRIFAIAAILVQTVYFVSCHKNNTSFDYSPAVETIPDYVEAQQMTGLLLFTYFKALSDTTLQNDSIATIDGATVTLQSNPATIKIDYSVWGNHDGYGHFRLGNYIATTETGFSEPQADVNFTFNGFMYDTDTVSVTGFKLKNDFIGNTTNPVYIAEAENLTRGYSDSTGTLSYRFNLNYKFYKDVSTPYYSTHDSFDIWGTIDGIARNNYPFVSTINEDDKLQHYYYCCYFLYGSSYVELPQFDYNGDVYFSNNGSCLNRYLISINDTDFKVDYN